jgi:hypothetical protein
MPKGKRMILEQQKGQMEEGESAKREQKLELQDQLEAATKEKESFDCSAQDDKGLAPL